MGCLQSATNYAVLLVSISYGAAVGMAGGQCMVDVGLAYAACAWNVRGQTGYFDNHPKPEDDELPIQRDQRLLQKAVREKELELAAAKEELEDVRAQFEKAKAEGLAQAHEEAKSISSKLP